MQNSLEIEIREARNSDIEPVVAIQDASKSESWSHFSFQEYLMHPDVYFYVASSDPKKKQITSFIIARKLSDQIEVLNFAVKPEHQGRGEGKLLFNYLLKKAAAAAFEYCILELRAGNKKALSLYRNAGLKVVGKRRAYYADNREDAVLMAGEINISD